MNRIGALAYRIIRQFLRDRRTMALIFLVPIVIMSLLTWVLKAESQPFRVAVLAGEEESVMVRDMLLNLLVKNANVKIVEGIDDSEVTEALKDGRIQGAIVLRGAGMDDLQAGAQSELEVALEGSDPMTSAEFFMDLKRIFLF